MGKEYKGDTDRLYIVWISMKYRCYNPKYHRFHNYGGRGITVCDEWRYSYKKFRQWALDNGYDYHALYGECTLDRINPNGNYEPDNCRWVNIKVQANNRRDNIKVTYNGETHTLPQWADITGINYKLLAQRYSKGWSLDEVFNPKIGKHEKIILELNGEIHNLAEWSRIIGINYDSLKYRYYLGWSDRDILTTPINYRHTKINKK